MSGRPPMKGKSSMARKSGAPGRSSNARMRKNNTSRSRLKLSSKKSSKSGTSRGGSSFVSGSRDKRIEIDGEDLTPLSLLPSKPAPESNQQAKTGSRSSIGSFRGNAATAGSAAKAGDASESKGDEAESKGPESPEEEYRAVKPLFTDAELAEPLSVTLTETPTIELFVLRGLCVQQDTQLHKDITARNADYEALLERKSNKDLFTVHAAQTFNPTVKHKEVMVAPPATKDVGCMSTSWDIYDSTVSDDTAVGDFLELEIDSSKKKKDDESELTRQVEEIVRMCLASPNCLLPLDEDGGAAAEAKQMDDEKLSGKEVIEMQQKRTVLTSEPLYRSLRLVERLLQQNVYHERHLNYRGLPPIRAFSDTGEAAEGEAAAADGAKGRKSALLDDRKQYLELFWSFSCELTKGMNVSCLCWNPVNHDLLAVAYGSNNFTDQAAGGLICFWSLKSPEFPERVLRTPVGATALDFSTQNPYLLAAGLFDGTIAVYDVRKKDAKPMLESGHGNGKHSHAVWQLQWIDKGGDKGGEVLVSVSTDGKLKEWQMKKGLTYTDLMLLKRIPHSNSLKWRPMNGKGEGIISRQASGLCFDFPVDNPTVYLAGTGDGLIHKCSCSYNEQYLQNFTGHNGPVYQLRCHPMHAPVFLTCSADWTIKLWSQEAEEALLTFQQTDLTDAVNDITWSPDDSTVFASVTSDGRAELWDLSVNVLQPQITHFTQKVPASMMRSVTAVVEVKEEEGEEGALGKKKTKVGALPDSQEEEMVPKKLTCVRFARNAPVLVTGDCLGSVDVYRIYGVGRRGLSKSLQIERLKTAMRAAQADHHSKGEGV